MEPEAQLERLSLGFRLEMDSVDRYEDCPSSCPFPDTPNVTPDPRSMSPEFVAIEFKTKNVIDLKSILVGKRQKRKR